MGDELLLPILPSFHSSSNKECKEIPETCLHTPGAYEIGKSMTISGC